MHVTPLGPLKGVALVVDGNSLALWNCHCGPQGVHGATIGVPTTPSVHLSPYCAQHLLCRKSSSKKLVPHVAICNNTLLTVIGPSSIEAMNKPKPGDAQQKLRSLGHRHSTTKHDDSAAVYCHDRRTVSIMEPGYQPLTCYKTTTMSQCR